MALNPRSKTIDERMSKTLKEYVVHAKNNGQIIRGQDGSYEGKYSIKKLINDVNRQENGKDRKDNQKEHRKETSITSISQYFTANHELLSRTVKAKIKRKHVIQQRDRIQFLHHFDRILERVGYVNGQGNDRGHIVAWSLGGTNHPLNLIPILKSLNRGEYSKLERKMIKHINRYFLTYDSTYVIKFENNIPTEMVISSLIIEEAKAHSCKIYIVSFNNNRISTLFARIKYTTNKKVLCIPKDFEGLEQCTQEQQTYLKTRLKEESETLRKKSAKFI